MSRKLSGILKKIFLTSLAGITSSNSSEAANNSANNKLLLNNEALESVLKVNRDLTPKLLLKIGANNEWTSVSHRSHRSHSSHRSHYSSYGGGSGSSSSGGSSGSTRSSGSNSTSSTRSNYNTSSSGTFSALQLGARTLKKGMSGTDVTELINILLRKKYLTMDDGSTYVTGSYTYTEVIKETIQQFQRDNKLDSDGVCGPTTTYYLKNK